MVDLCTTHLPENKPRYLMGVGYSMDLVVCSALGVDMFDCVFPTRYCAGDCKKENCLVHPYKIPACVAFRRQIFANLLFFGSDFIIIIYLELDQMGCFAMLLKKLHPEICNLTA